MKKLLTLALLATLSVPALAADPAAGNPELKIKVNGLVCDFCAQSIEKVFRKQEAVNDIKVDLDNGEITVDLKDGQSLADEKVTQLITDAGYTVTDIIHQ